jgi:probable phosphoglycerate mutase
VRDAQGGAASADGGSKLTEACLALLRHGHTAWNRAGRLQGRIDEPLDAAARAHLEGLSLPGEFRPATLVSSPLARAVETASIVGRRVPLIEPALTEMAWGAWEGCRGVDLLSEPGSGFLHVEEWSWDFQPPGGETPRMVWGRLKPWLETISGTVVAVTHVGVMRVILARATGWNFVGPAPFRVKRDRLYRIGLRTDGTLAFDGKPVRLVGAGPR